MAAGAETSSQTSTLKKVQPMLARLLLWALIWWTLAAGQGWWFFLALVPLLFWCSWLWPVPLLQLRWRYLPSFLFYFFQQMWLGGLDVAWRACRINPAISPNWQRYSVRLQHASSHRVFACLISLMPGTTACRSQLSAESSAEKAERDETELADAAAWLELHILREDHNWHQAVAELELRLSRLLGQEAPLC